MDKKTKKRIAGKLERLAAEIDEAVVDDEGLYFELVDERDCEPQTTVHNMRQIAKALRESAQS